VASQSDRVEYYHSSDPDTRKEKGMMRTLLAAVAVSLATVVAVADDKPKAEPPKEKLAAIQKEAKEAETKLYKTLNDLGEDKEAQKKAGELLKEHEKEQTKRYEAALELAKADPKSDVAFDALAWLLEATRTYYLPVGKPAMELVLEHHVANPKIGPVVFVLAQIRRFQRSREAPPGDALLKAVAEKNPDKTVRGQVAVARAWEAKGKFDVAERKKQKDADELAAAADKAFEIVVKEYGECKLLDTYQKTQPTLAEVSKIELFELRNLRVGKAAPDIDGEDLDGVKFKLSDYRGKVTVVTFWGSWCGPCMAMVPHERSLVERLKDKPFVLIGVNSDADKGKLAGVLEKNKMTWRSFWNGPDGADGPISWAWNVMGWPTVYVIDAKGVIRAKNVREKEMDKAVDELLKEMGVPEEKNGEKKEKKDDKKLCWFSGNGSDGAARQARGWEQKL
jgi:thiol-disulfide isomerase/thioredoxin